MNVQVERNVETYIWGQLVDWNPYTFQPKKGNRKRCNVADCLYWGYVRVHLASYPGSRWAGKERAWYPLFAHALNLRSVLVKF